MKPEVSKVSGDFNGKGWRVGRDGNYWNEIESGTEVAKPSYIECSFCFVKWISKAGTRHIDGAGGSPRRGRKAATRIPRGVR